MTGGEGGSPAPRAPLAEDNSAINSPCIPGPRREVTKHVGPRAHRSGQVRVNLPGRAGLVARDPGSPLDDDQEEEEKVERRRRKKKRSRNGRPPTKSPEGRIQALKRCGPNIPSTPDSWIYRIKRTLH